MSRVYKRASSPLWQAEWHDLAGRRHQRSTQCTDRRAAEASADAGREAPEDPAALALSCAWSRLRICRGHDVTLAEVARLASVTSGRVRQLVTTGEITATAGSAREPSTVTAAEARRWLAARGLKGW